MPRYAFRIEYDGGPFCGWQRQVDLPTVQGQIENAARRIEPNHTGLFGAGRTDTGVHATGQVAHLDTEKEWAPDKLRQAINHFLKPDPIALTAATLVDGNFHARFSATKRLYQFRVTAQRSPMVLDRGRTWHINHKLDVAVMQAAAAHLIGKHDFTTFRSTLCQARSPVKTLEKLAITETRVSDARFDYAFDLEALSFLHNQVRSLVGTLERVGAGSWEPIDVANALMQRDRSACGPVAPPDGLYLRDVQYPMVIFKTKF